MSQPESDPPLTPPTHVEVPRNWFGQLMSKLARAQVRQTKWFLIIALLLTVVAIPIASRLKLDASFEALLPETAPSVVDLKQLVDRFGVASTMSLAVQAEDRDKAFEATKRLAKRLEASNDPALTTVDWGIKDFQQFAKKHKYLYADKDFLKEFQQDLHARVEWEAEHQSPFDLGLDEGLDVEEPPTIEELKERVEKEAEKAQADLPDYERGLFAHPELPLAIIFLRTDITSNQLSQVDALIERIEGHLAEIRKDPELASAQVDYGGDLMDVYIETKMLARQMAFAGGATLLAVMLVVYLFFRSWRAVPVLGLCIIPPVAVTFAAAQLTVGFLNTSTAFLMSIVIGNGINPNVIWLARYFEERLGGYEHEAAIRTTHAATWSATLVASLAAGLAYASLAITDFRGFRDFGIIGGIGMALCWISAFTLLPTIVLSSERLAPLRPRRLAQLKRNPYGRFFAWLAFSRPKTSVAVGAVLTVFSVIGVGLAIQANPIEYDFRKLTSERKPDSRIQWVNDRQGEIVSETKTGSAIAILSPTRADTPEVVAQLEAYAEKNPRVLGPIRSIESLIPDNQKEKIPIIEQLREDLLRAKKFASEEEKEELEPHIPPKDISPVGDEDLPEEVRQTFTERDGTVGRLVFSEHHLDRNNWDGRYWVEWAQAVRAIDIDGKRPPSTGNALVFADILDSLATEGPQAILAALTATIVLLLVSLRSWRHRFLTLSALLGGILWMAGAMAGLRIRLNFLNFVAFPITFGNGADYGINVIVRYIVEERRLSDARRALREAVQRTGGAVVLCSLTTIIGYVSLYTSSNRALNSFGIAMAISEVTCVATAVLIMPAWMAWKMDKASPGPGEPTHDTNVDGQKQPSTA